MPPFSRSEKIEDYASQCRGVKWREERIRAADGVKLAIAVGGLGGEDARGAGEGGKRVLILYFQGYRLTHLPPLLVNPF